MNPNEPRPATGVPEAPARLSERARGVWPELSELLKGMGVLTLADGFALEGLSEAYADLKEARDALAARGGLTYECRTKGGSIMIRAYPEVGMVSDADKRFKAWLATFGLTPADRSKVSALFARPTNKFLAIAEHYGPRTNGGRTS